MKIGSEKMKLSILLFFVSFSSLAQGQWSIRPQVGLGYTNNANFEDTEKDTDLFWWVRSSNSYNTPGSHYNLWLNYRAYTKERQNDVFSFRIADVMEMNSRSFGDFDWDVALGGQQFLNESPATTENSFNHVYAETSLAKTWILRNDLEISLEPLYQLKYFSQLEARKDHTVQLNFTTDWHFQTDQNLIPYAEFGFVFSDQSLYNKNYFEFGSDWRVSPHPNLNYVLNFVSRYSSFPNRSVSETTVVSSSKGRTKTQSQDGIETQSFFQIQGSVVKIVSGNELRAALAFNNQSSKSGNEDYSEIQLQTSVLIPF
jgi:hypothetical protein